MVLQELGDRLAGAINQLNASSIIDESAVKLILTELTRALLESDVNIKLVMKLKQNVEAKLKKLTGLASDAGKKKMLQQAVFDELVNMVDPKSPPFKAKKGKSNVIMFVGLQGSGKTTTIAKFARYYQVRGWKVSMVCADTFRAGAFDQLKQNATKLRVPFYGSYSEADPVRIAEEGVNQFRKDQFEIIIVDTSGRHKQEEALFEEMQEIREVVKPNCCVFVMDATQGQAVGDQAKAFHESIPVGSVIVTKLDGHAKGGGALSAVASTGSPIIFLGTGEHFDDFEPFVARSFVSCLLGLAGEGKGEKNADPLVEQKKLMERMNQGKFSLRDFQKQLQTMAKLGPLSKMMGGMPGLPDEFQQKRFLYIFDSMTPAELDCKVELPGNKKRIVKIARGSGTREIEVELLLRLHKSRQKMVASMGKSGMMNAATDPSKASKMAQLMQNPNSRANQAAMSKMMTPQMLKQVGGKEGLAKRMKEMGGANMPQGYNPDMAQMMQQMGNMDMSQMMQQMGGASGMAKLMQQMGGLGFNQGK
mmetsp:Transcript_7485/g.10510  ORF Transcript_7485/g.10510 Transcript_7485/m.10510 type:complete len:533 (+) Transcript_7485:26-1624(+)